jgi:hypothetical protein
MVVCKWDTWKLKKTDILRDSLIGLAPLIAGTLFVAYAGIYKMQLHTLWNVLRDGQVGTVLDGIGVAAECP